MKIYKYTLGAFLVFACHSCVQDVKQKEDSVETANKINDNKENLKEDEDFEFVTETASSGMMEVQLAKMAGEKAQTKEVKMLASHMAEDHSKSNEELQKIAMSKKITLPLELSLDDKKMMKEVAGKSGIDFDKEYVDKMIKAHKSAIDNFEDASKNCEDSDIKNFALSALPTLKMHLEMARQTEEKIKDKKNKYD